MGILHNMRLLTFQKPYGRLLGGFHEISRRDADGIPRSITMLITVIGRGHSGTRAISHTLSASGVYMGEPLNVSGDLLPPQKMYDACRVFAQYVDYTGDLQWDFSKVLSSEPTPEFRTLIEEYLHTVLNSTSKLRGWKIPETTLVYPWILKMFPDAAYIFWVRDPRDCILNSHLTDDLADFGVKYSLPRRYAAECKTDADFVRLRRAISWFYQREIVRTVPAPAKSISFRFEDMVFDQDAQLARLSDFIGVPAAKIEMRTDSVGRYKNDSGIHYYDFFESDMKELNYI
jgi:hypothetical protein